MPAKVRGVCRKPIPWPVAGASTITRSYSCAFFTLRLGWASSQIFPIVTSSLRPGVAAGEVVEDPRADQQVAHGPDLELEQQVLAQGLVRVDRDRPEVVRDLDLVEADLGAPEDARGGLLAADLADDRSLAPGGRGEAQGDRDRRLADPALAGHEDQALVE